MRQPARIPRGEHGIMRGLTQAQNFRALLHGFGKRRSRFYGG
jgi:hypothetical protein